MTQDPSSGMGSDDEQSFGSGDYALLDDLSSVK